VTAVAGAVYDRIGGFSCRASLQNGFQRAEIVIVGGERNVVYEDNEFKRIGAYAFDDIGNITKLFLCYFNETKSSVGKFVYNGCGKKGKGIQL